MKEDFPSNEVEFDRRSHAETACLDDFFQFRWPEGFISVVTAIINNW